MWSYAEQASVTVARAQSTQVSKIKAIMNTETSKVEEGNTQCVRMLSVSYTVTTVREFASDLGQNSSFQVRGQINRWPWGMCYKCLFSLHRLKYSKQLSGRGGLKTLRPLRHQSIPCIVGKEPKISFFFNSSNPTILIQQRDKNHLKSNNGSRHISDEFRI